MKYIDISEWASKVSSTKGTRDKGVVFSPDDGEMYFIKFPMIREKRDYSMETWSEIIAYEVGTALGFNVLRYDFAVKDGRAGCISKNMVEETSNSYLIEGDSILTAYDPTYDPEDKSMYNKYTFPFVMRAFDNLHLGQWKKDFVRILLFDAIIGNSDRHQSNWGFINHITKKDGHVVPEMTITPIYDSGCCLGREFSEEQVKERLADNNRLLSYVNKGLAELRPNSNSDKKVNHFDLLKSILENSEWHDFLESEITKLAAAYKEETIKGIIEHIDDAIPSETREVLGMSDNRKELVARLIDIRITKINELI